MKGINVLIVEDDAFSRSTLIDALKRQGLNVVGATDNARDALTITQNLAPDVALCDLDLGVGPTGLDVAIALRRISPNIGVIMLTSYRDPRLVDPNLPSLPEGAILMNKKELTSMAILGMHINAAATQPRKKRKSNWEKSGKFQSLSAIQIEILKSVAEGLTTAEIAKVRHVSEQNIEKTIQRICKNLEIQPSNDRNQRVQLVRAFFYGAGNDI